MKTSAFPNLDELFTQYDRSKNIKFLEEIAKRLLNGERPINFSTNFPDKYEKYIQTMQRMRIIGKNKQGKFTPGEQVRAEMSVEEKGLTISRRKTSGSAKGEQLTQSRSIVQPGKTPTSYMVKEGNPTEILVEGVGARFYAKFAGAQGNVTAKTRFVSSSNKFDAEQRDIRTGSCMLSDYRDSWGNGGPPIIVDDKIVVASDQAKEVKGYIATLVTAKFLQDFDAVGYGPNAGYIKQPIIKGDRTLYASAKIDPGNSFSFIARPYDDSPSEAFSNSALGIVTNLNNSIKMNDTNPSAVMPNDFYTSPPLDMLDPNDLTKFRPEACAFEVAARGLNPSFDTRDLLLGDITYAQIAKSPKLYKQMAKAVESIANTSDTELHDLIYNNVPQEINGQNVAAIQAEMLKGLKVRRNLMGKLYAKEIEYMKLYREAKSNGENIDFEALKSRAQNIVTTNKRSPKETNIPLTKELREILLENNSDLIHAALSFNNPILARTMIISMRANNQQISDDVMAEIPARVMTRIEQEEQKINTQLLEKAPIVQMIKGENDVLMNSQNKNKSSKLKILSKISRWLRNSSSSGSVHPESTPATTNSDQSVDFAVSKKGSQR